MARKVLFNVLFLCFAQLAFHAHFANAQCLNGCTCQNPTTIACLSSSVCPGDLDSFYASVSLISTSQSCGTSLVRSAFSPLVNLHILIIQDQQDYVSIEDQAFADTKMTELTIKETSLRSISANGLSGLSALTNLDLSSNVLQSLPDNVFAELTALEHLLLNDNQLTSLSNDIFAGLSKLTSLDLANNMIATLSPNCFKPLTTLRSLKLSHNHITTLPNDFLSGVPISSLTVDNNRLATIPQDAFRGSSLMGLMMENNQLTQFPGAALRRLPAMIVALAMRNNRVSEITDARNLTLGNVALDNNPLTRIAPGSFHNSTIDFVLSLSGTQLTTLPSDMTQVIAGSARLVLEGLTGWECLCDSLWLARFLNNSATSLSPACVGSGKPLGQSLQDVQLVCSLTTLTPRPTSATATTSDGFSGASRGETSVVTLLGALLLAGVSARLSVIGWSSD